MESVTDRTETHAVVNNNLLVSFKDTPVQLSIHLPLITECAIGLVVRGALQMQSLLKQLQAGICISVSHQMVYSIMTLLIDIWISKYHISYPKSRYENTQMIIKTINFIKSKRLMQLSINTLIHDMLA